MPTKGEQFAGLTVAISREAGSRGTSIAKRAGEKLGWQVYTQELLEYLAQEGSHRQELAGTSSAAGERWCEQRLDQLLREQNLSQHPSVANLTRIMLTQLAEPFISTRTETR